MRTRRPPLSSPLGRREPVRWPRLSRLNPVWTRPPLALAAAAVLALLLLGFLSVRMLQREPPTAPGAAEMARAAGDERASSSKEDGSVRRAERVAIPGVRITERASDGSASDLGRSERAAPSAPDTTAPPLSPGKPDETDDQPVAAEPPETAAAPGATPAVKGTPAAAGEGRREQPVPLPASPPGGPTAKPQAATPRPVRPPVFPQPAEALSPAGATRPAPSEPARPDAPSSSAVPSAVDRPPPAPAAPEIAASRPPAQPVEREGPVPEPVALRVVVEPQGRARSAVVIRSSGDPRRDARAVQQALRRRYRAPRSGSSETELSVEISDGPPESSQAE